MLSASKDHLSRRTGEGYHVPDGKPEHTGRVEPLPDSQEPKARYQAATQKQFLPLQQRLPASSGPLVIGTFARCLLASF